MLELWAFKHEPVGHIVSFGVFSDFTFDGIKDGNGLLSFLLLFKFFVFLNYYVSLFDFTLISFDLVRRERYPSETVQKREDIACL